MEVRFRTKKLKKQYEQSGEATKAYGREVGRRYIGRIDIIKQALDINELCGLPVLHCHSLKGDRLGQWSITLVNFYRLIFTLEGSKLEIVEIALTFQESRIPQICGVKGEAVVLYREPLTTKELWYPRLSHRVNNMAVFRCFQDFTWSTFQHLTLKITTTYNAGL